MKFYQGPKPGDERPIGGGSYNKDEIGHEAYNFLNIDGFLYGYFQPHMTPPYEINLSRIMKGCNSEKIDDVLVIWFATNPIDKGQVIVGWYNHATVFRSIQSPNTLHHRENYNYNIIARASDCTLLPISKRKFPAGHGIEGIKEGNPGQSNVFYTLDEKGSDKDTSKPINNWIKKTINYITNYSGTKIKSREDEIQEDIQTAEYSTGGMGFQSDVEVRLKIETHAMAICKSHYEGLGYTVEDVSATKPYDFIINKDQQTRFIEVKGTQSTGTTIILTRNEVELSRVNGSNMALFLVHSILMNKKSVKKESGTIAITDPWHVIDEKLTPISFTYTLS
jgi:hypothetical protein